MTEKQADQKFQELQSWFNTVGCPETYLSDGEYESSSVATIFGNGFPSECLVTPPQNIKKIIKELKRFYDEME